MQGDVSGAVQHINVIEARRGRDAVNFRLQLGNFVVQVLTVVCVERVVRRLNGQFAHTLQHVRDFNHRAFGRGSHRLTIACVADRLVQTVDLGCHA